MPSYVSDHSIGLSFFGRPISAIELGGWAIGLVGLFNIIGTLLWGWLGGHHVRKDMLALLKKRFARKASGCSQSVSLYAAFM